MQVRMKAIFCIAQIDRSDRNTPKDGLNLGQPNPLDVTTVAIAVGTR